MVSQILPFRCLTISRWYPANGVSNHSKITHKNSIVAMSATIIISGLLVLLRALWRHEQVKGIGALSWSQACTNLNFLLLQSEWTEKTLDKAFSTLFCTHIHYLSLYIVLNLFPPFPSSRSMLATSERMIALGPCFFYSSHDCTRSNHG